MMESKLTGTGFYKHIIISSLVVFLLGAYPVYAYTSITQFYSIISGYIIGLLNAIAGYQLNTIAFNKSVKSFMLIVFGGMGLRMIFIAIIILIFLYILKLEEIPLVASVFIFYILFVAIELLHLHKQQLRIKNELASSNKN